MTRENIITLAAYFYPATRAQKAQGLGGIYELVRFDSLEPGKRRLLGETRPRNVTEARQQAKIDGATPWNF